ncbi:DUF2637 domain-containing protein [Streptomyces sp. NPDC002589]|uniref:DUF2637 domain-containing protein n=1 Tax=Streptomyces sp. NPDC002589 TaxID=3154420 RepID=UPI003333C6E1
MTSRTTATTPSDIPGGKAIRFGITVLAAVAFVLSYDALRQMAVATHIRGLLTYAFPLVIDGFIGIGIGAQLVLRSAPPRSRRYVGTLVALATGVSIWANALHAIRLNQQTRPDGGLRLGDLTVGALSALAPLALAGAVHLYLIIRRHSTPHHQEASTTNHPEVPGPSNSGDDIRPAIPAEGQPDLPSGTAPESQPDSGNAVPAQTTPTPRRTGRPPNASLEELLAMARPVVERMGEVDRDAIAAEIRDVQRRKVANGRLANVIDILTKEHEAASATPIPSA